MSDDAVAGAMAALAHAELPKGGSLAEALLYRAALQRRLQRAAQGAAVLDRGLPAVLASVCFIAIVFVVPVIAADRSPVFAAAAWSALALFASAAAVATAQALSRH